MKNTVLLLSLLLLFAQCNSNIDENLMSSMEAEIKNSETELPQFETDNKKINMLAGRLQTALEEMKAKADFERANPGVIATAHIGAPPTDMPSNSIQSPQGGPGMPASAGLSAYEKEKLLTTSTPRDASPQAQLTMDAGRMAAKHDATLDGFRSKIDETKNLLDHYQAGKLKTEDIKPEFEKIKSNLEGLRGIFKLINEMYGKFETEAGKYNVEMPKDSLK